MAEQEEGETIHHIFATFQLPCINQSFLWHFQDFSLVAFAENALLKSCGMISV